MSRYPKARDPALVGSYDALAKAGGGYVRDAVLGYRVWCHPHDGAEDLEDGAGYIHVTERRITEWPPAFPARSRGRANTIPDFLSPDAPANRLDIIRGLDKKP